MLRLMPAITESPSNRTSFKPGLMGSRSVIRCPIAPKNPEMNIEMTAIIFIFGASRFIRLISEIRK